MGSSAPERMAHFKHPDHINLYDIDRNYELIAFSIKYYDQQGSLTDHSQVQALIETQNGYTILRLSFASNGLTIVQLQEPRRTPYLSSRTKHYKILQYSKQSAYKTLFQITKSYYNKQYSVIFSHCQDFTDQIQQKLRWYGSKCYSDIWHHYNRL